MRLSIILAFLILASLCTPSSTETLEARAAFQKGYELLEGGEYFSAINSFNITVKDPHYPLVDYGFYFTAQAYQKSGHPEHALAVYEILIKYFQNSALIPKAMFETAQNQTELNNYAAAVSILRKLIVQFPKHENIPQARYLLGSCLEKMEKYEDAARVYRNLDLLHPDSDFAEKAIERLDQLAKKSPLAGYEAPAATIYNLGIKYFKGKNYKKAKGYFNRLAKFYRKSSFYDEALMMLGRIHLRKGNFKSAVGYFKKARNLGKDSKPEAMFYLALTRAYLGDPRAAIWNLEKLVSLFPNSHSADDALYYAGSYYLQLGSTPEALQTYERLISSYPGSELFANSLWLVGNIYFKQKDFHKAYEHFSRAFDLPPKKASDQLLFWSAKCAQKIGKREEAIRAYKMTINRYDHSFYGYRAREELEKYGIYIRANAVPDISEIINVTNGESLEEIDHEKKYQELLALGLGDEAAEEASFLAEKVSLSKKDKAHIAKYHAYVIKGKFSQPIWFAERKIEEAMLTGALSQVDPRLWRFSYPRGYWQYVEKYSKMYGLDPYLTYAVIREESRFKSRALSRSWAHGLMQIIPSTGRRLARLLGMRYSRWKLYDPRVNIQMGTYYLSQLIRRFDGNLALALAGYNGGPVKVNKWLKKYDHENFDIDEFIEDIPVRETRNYVKKVLKSYYGYKRTYGG